jgi:SnoaL-like domain
MDCHRTASVAEMTELESRARIEDALNSYCRGIDRLHAPSIEAAFHPGAVLMDYGVEPFTIEAFVPYVLASLSKRFVATQHRLSNTTVKLDGDAALVESYVLATHVAQNDAGRTMYTFTGRYIDQFECRDGDWRIVHRSLRNDWSSIEPMGEPMSGPYIPSGRAGTLDPFLG